MTSSLKYASAQFVTSAPKLALCPTTPLAEVAFAGRSNAGKSSAINTLARNKSLARTSKTPGRTQLINFFQLGTHPYYLVDLPGYGFAKVPEAVKQKWQRHLSEYLHQRHQLKGVVLVMDIRHPLTEFDQMMLQWADERHLPLHILLTKADKLKSGAAKNALFQVQKSLAEAGWADLVSVQKFSSLKREGIQTLEQVLDTWLLEAAVLEKECGVAGDTTEIPSGSNQA